MLFVNMDKLWYTRHPLRWFLLPFALLYQVISECRRFFLQRFRQPPISIPVIVVGNLTVGGVGKTPLVIALANQLRARDVRVGIVSRGYGARVRHFPYEVTLNSKTDDVGDEPLLLAQKTGCPVVIAPKRRQAVQYLMDNHQSQIILSDDGLQHYAMARAMEIVVIDGTRGLGNGWCLPAGPLRESARRLKSADFVIINGGEWPGAHRMDLMPGKLTRLISGQSLEVSKLEGTVAAVAAIGNPQRFFTTLTKLGVKFNAYPFADHHRFQLNELQFAEKVIVMTEKDAVKCRAFATETMYFLPVEAKISDAFWKNFWSHKQLQDYV
ncbi:tetraacyldisaccharide 4'-kinase [Legionella nagasakiensis]|uniref:tetraacyldisaccharide 4'-kinase n=1 Tax=Legionella nagasakiensis TaxID=535290 RepID=UPI0010557A0F|nr:tetraacyldisaccharide 4'-kinase [Legionella nagasakiensis]